jgi:hypothetical protein
VFEMSVVEQINHIEALAGELKDPGITLQRLLKRATAAKRDIVYPLPSRVPYGDVPVGCYPTLTTAELLATHSVWPSKLVSNSATVDTESIFKSQRIGTSAIRGPTGKHAAFTFAKSELESTDISDQLCTRSILMQGLTVGDRSGIPQCVLVVASLLDAGLTVVDFLSPREFARSALPLRMLRALVNQQRSTMDVEIAN